MDLSIYVLRKLRKFMRLKMNRKRDINDWLLWLMVFRIFMDFHGWEIVILYLVLAIALYAADKFLNEKMEGKE